MRKKKIEIMLTAKKFRLVQAESKIEELNRQIKLMDDALMDIASLPTVGGAIARKAIRRIREELGLCEPS